VITPFIQILAIAAFTAFMSVKLFVAEHNGVASLGVVGVALLIMAASSLIRKARRINRGDSGL
jgi:uncharacterized membrane-anchored protein YitT (DUF2179 family)